MVLVELITGAASLRRPDCGKKEKNISKEKISKKAVFMTVSVRRAAAKNHFHSESIQTVNDVAH